MINDATNLINSEREQLWENFLSGDKGAFEMIYRRHVKHLLNYGYKVTSDRKLIEDSIQDLFYDLWQRREKLSHTTSIKFYLFRAIRYKIIRNGKDKNIDLTDSYAEDEVFGEDFSQEQYLIETETQTLQQLHLKDIISKLPKRQQEAINLRYYHNFSNEEVAEIMEVNYQSACKFIYTALKSLRLNLKTSVLSLIPLIFLIFF